MKSRHQQKVNLPPSYIEYPVYCQPPQELLIANPRPHISEVYNCLAELPSRTEEVTGDIYEAITHRPNPIILTEQRGYAETLVELLKKNGISLVVLEGISRTDNNPGFQAILILRS